MKVKSKKKKTKKKAAPARTRRGRKRGVLKLRIPIRTDKTAIQDVEGTIAEKLRTLPTDVFTKNDEVILELEKFAWKPYS
jgi:hypothetical protein